MCGPLRLLSLGTRGALWKYQSGRALAYLGLGLAAGGAGAQLPLWALLPLLLLGISFSFVEKKLAPIGKAHAWILRAASSHTFLLGLASGALPCGLLYAWVAVATASGSALQGAGLLGVLWLGTLPALEGGSTLLRAPLTRLRMRFPRALPLAFLLIALLPLLHRLPIVHGSEKHSQAHIGPSCHSSSEVGK